MSVRAPVGTRSSECDTTVRRIKVAVVRADVAARGGESMRGHDPVCVAVEAGAWSWTDQGEIFSGQLEDPELVHPHSC